MLPETGPETPFESDSHVNNNPEREENIAFQNAGGESGKDEPQDALRKLRRKPDEADDKGAENGGPATRDRLEELKAKGIGSEALEEPEKRPEVRDEETEAKEKITPMPEVARTQIPEESPRGKPLADVAKSSKEVPADIAAKGPDAVREYLESREDRPSEILGKEPVGQIISDETTAPPPNTQPTPEQTPTPPEKKGGFFSRFFGGGEQKEPEPSQAPSPTPEPARESEVKAEETPASTESRQPEIPNEKVEAKLNELETGQRSKGASIYLGDERFIWQGYDPEKGTYSVRDEQGKLHTLTKDAVNGMLRSELEKEAQAPTETIKPESRADETTGRPLEQVSKRASELLEKAKENKVGNFFLKQGNAFLNNFDWRDKEKGWWVAGIASGAAVNAGLTTFVPFLAVGPGRILRSAVFSAAIKGVSFGANVFRNRAVNKILTDFGISDRSERANYAGRFDENLRLLSKSEEGDYHEAMKKLSEEIFTKYGNASSRSDAESAVSEYSAEELQKRVESLGSKYQKLNRNIRSFSAGLSAGSLSATGFFATDEAFGIVDKMGDTIKAGAGGISDAARWVGDRFDSGPGTPSGVPHETATPTPSAGVDHSPTPTPTPEQPTPTPEPEPTPTPTPEPGETPGGEVPDGGETPPISEQPGNFSELISNSEFSNTIEIQQGDTVGALLTNAGYEVDWGPDNAELFGAHLQANYDMLQNMHDNVAASGVAVEAFPDQAEIATLVQQAQAGDAVAMHRLTESLHWVPAGGEINVLTPEGLEQARRLLRPGG